MPTNTQRPQPEVSRSVVAGVDGYSRSVAGVKIEAVRTASGTGPNRVLAVRDDRFTLTSCDIGFPMMSRTTVDDGRIILAHIAEAPVGSRWCEMDLTPGLVIAYGPGAEHTAVNLPGLRFSFVIAGHDELAALADRFEVDITPPPNGRVRALGPNRSTRAAGAAQEALAADADRGVRSLGDRADDVLRTMVDAFAGSDPLQPIGRRSRIDSRHVTHVCLDYAMATQRIPSITELCVTSHLSERRLRQAFTDEFDVPPSRFFRAWALEAAHRRLRACERSECTVAEVATDLGFCHLGRFAGYYRKVFGETPSDTLQTNSVG